MRLIILMLILLSNNLYAADIGYKLSHHDDIYLLHIEGKIVDGDYDKLVNIIRNDPEYYLNHYIVIVNSNGGNVLESIRIGDLFKKTFRKIEVVNVCASSCFNVYVGAVNRNIGDGKLGVHRPNFPRELFSNLTPEKAEVLQISMMARVRDFLSSNFIPQGILDKMFSTPSTDIYWLDRNDIKILGERSTWYDEYLTARCNYDDRDENGKSWLRMLADYKKYFLDVFPESERIKLGGFDFKKSYVNQCESDIISEESTNYIYNELLVTRTDKKAKPKMKNIKNKFFK